MKTLLQKPNRVLAACQPIFHVALTRIWPDFKWHLHHVATVGQAIAFTNLIDTAVVVCERELPDGGWKVLLDSFHRLPKPPKLIVTSRITDDALWAEVLNLGGYDVLAQPFCPEEVFQVISRACCRPRDDRTQTNTALVESSSLIKGVYENDDC